MILKRELRIGLLALLLAAALSFLFLKSSSDFRPADTDFSQYRAASRALQAGLNPYDPAVILAEQRKIDPDRAEAIMMWNPPWAAILLAPFTAGSYTWSYHIWFAANTAFYLFSVVLICSFYGMTFGDERRSYAPLLPVFLLFYPAWNNIMSGQIGLFLTFSLAAFLWCEKNNRDFLAGLSLLPLTLKPHLFLPVWIMLLYVALRERRRWMIYFPLVFAALVCATFLIFPGSIRNWLDSMVRAPQAAGYVPVTEWRSETLPGWLRQLSAAVFGVRSDWLMWAVPAATSALFLAVLAVKRPLLNFGRDLPILLALSLFTAPYGWCSDFSLLLITFIYGTLLAREGGSLLIRRGAALCFVLLNAGYFVFSVFDRESHRWMFLAPAAAILFVCAVRLSPGRKTTQSPCA